MIRPPTHIRLPTHKCFRAQIYKTDRSNQHLKQMYCRSLLDLTQQSISIHSLHLISEFHILFNSQCLSDKYLEKRFSLPLSALAIPYLILALQFTVLKAGGEVQMPMCQNTDYSFLICLITHSKFGSENLLEQKLF